MEKKETWLFFRQNAKLNAIIENIYHQILLLLLRQSMITYVSFNYRVILLHFNNIDASHKSLLFLAYMEHAKAATITNNLFYCLKGTHKYTHTEN